MDRTWFRGCRLCKDGIHALELAKHTKPDAIVTDIGMPGMNGLDLIAELQKFLPNLQSIILSCHDDFHYARQAVQLNVLDYVLKESMEVEEVIDILKKLTIQVAERNEVETKHASLVKLVHQNQSGLKEKIIHSLLNQPIFNEKEWLTKLAEFQVTLDRKSYMPVLCLINNYTKQLKRFQSDEMLAYATMNTLEELTQKDINAICFPANTKSFILLIPDQRSILTNLDERIGKPLQNIQQTVQSVLKVELSFIYAEQACSDARSLKKELQQLMNVAEHRFYMQKTVTAVVSDVERPYAEEDIFQYYAEATESFRTLLTGDVNEHLIRSITAKWGKICATHHYPPETVKSFFLKIMLDYQLKLKAVHSFDTAFSSELLHQSVITTETLQELLEAVVQFFLSHLLSLSNTEQRSKRKEIIIAQQYVEKNLDKKITLEEVAELLHLNASYFSRLFKKEMQESFIVYVTRMKMEKAKEWLETSKFSVEEIAYRLGYDNKSYFNKRFRTIYGKNPSRFQSYS